MKLILIIGGVLLTGIVAFMQYFEDEKIKKDAKDNERSLNKKVDTLKNINLNLLEKISNLAIDNLKLSQQLTETSLKLNETTFGAGDLKIIPTLVNTTEIKFQFQNINNLPVYDAYITIINYDELDKCKVVSKTKDNVIFAFTCREKSVYQEPPLTINSQSAIMTGKSFTFDQILHFSVLISSRKKTIMSQYAYCIVNGEFKYCVRNFNIIHNKPVFINEVKEYQFHNEDWERYFYGTRNVMFIKK